MSWLTRTLCQCSLSLGLPISSFVGFTAQNFSDNFSEVWRRLFRIDTALNISEVIFVLLVTYLFCQSHICSVSHIFVLLVTYLFCQSHICSVSHIFVFRTEQIDGKQVAGTTSMSDAAICNYQFFSPTDAQLDNLQNNFKFALTLILLMWRIQ